MMLKLIYLLKYGILKNYVVWVLHGEEFDKSNNEEFYLNEKK